MKDILGNLNPEQKEAVLTTEGPVLIIAGAGSGKTRVLTHRITYLIYQKRISPQHILAVTFTNKAAAEMKKRIAKLLGRNENDHFRLMPFLGTFHSICVRILREEAKTLGFKSNFAIFDTADQKTVVKKAMEKLQIDPKQYAPELILNMISGAKNELLTPQDYAKYVSSSFHEIVLAVYAEYQRILKDNQALDFDDLIMKTVWLYKKYPEILIKWQKRFQYILVDEYQDTNRAQYMLVKLLAAEHKNICVVGDDAQAIYGWRGADIRNILNFESDFPKTKIIKLEQNYRSTKRILAAAHEIICKNVVKKEKQLWTENEEGVPVTIFEAQNEKNEAEFIVNEIKSLSDDSSPVRTSQLSLKDFVVLYRTNAQSRAIEEIFLKYGLPYRIIGGTKFYSRKEIKDTLAYLRAIYNLDDLVSLERIINLPPRGITPKTWTQIVSLFEKNGKDLEKVKIGLDKLEIINSRAQKAVTKFLELMAILREAAHKLNIEELIDFVLSATKYKEYLLDGTIEAESRWENIQELKSVTKNFKNMAPIDSLGSFLEEVSLVAEIDNWDPNSEAVTLMTAHNAKGLEFAVVFMVGLEEGLFPHANSLLEPAEMEEERRLCYVGMTRAKKMLYLLFARSRLLYGSIQVNLRSRFLDDLSKELIDEISHEQIKPASQSSEGTDVSVDDINQDLETNISFTDGDRIEHEEFGQGIIVELDGDIATVAFAGVGVKKLSLSIAPIKKLKN